jgi:hypothetical protein
MERRAQKMENDLRQRSMHVDFLSRAWGRFASMRRSLVRCGRCRGTIAATVGTMLLQHDALSSRWRGCLVRSIAKSRGRITCGYDVRHPPPPTLAQIVAPWYDPSPRARTASADRRAGIDWERASGGTRGGGAARIIAATSPVRASYLLWSRGPSELALLFWCGRDARGELATGLTALWRLGLQLRFRFTAQPRLGAASTASDQRQAGRVTQEGVTPPPRGIRPAAVPVLRSRRSSASLPADVRCPPES